MLCSQDREGRILTDCGRPLIGGFFAEPASEFPTSIGRVKLFRDFPYLLPCLIAGIMSFAFFAVGLVGLKEVCFDVQYGMTLY
jgi:hypothetical protein